MYKTLNHVLTSSTNFNQKFLISLPRLGPVGAKPWARIVGAFLQGRRTQPGERATNILHLYKVGNAIFFSSFFFFLEERQCHHYRAFERLPTLQKCLFRNPFTFRFKILHFRATNQRNAWKWNHTSPCRHLPRMSWNDHRNENFNSINIYPKFTLRLFRCKIIYLFIFIFYKMVSKKVIF